MTATATIYFWSLTWEKVFIPFFYLYFEEKNYNIGQKKMMTPLLEEEKNDDPPIKL